MGILAGGHAFRAEDLEGDAATEVYEQRTCEWYNANDR